MGEKHEQVWTETHPEAVEKLEFSAVGTPRSTESAGKPTDNTPDYNLRAQNGVPATRKEVWSYYAFYAADNGIGTYQ